MSYDRPYGNRRRHNREEERREVYDSPEQKLKTAIIKLGEVDPYQEIASLVDHLREQPLATIPVISEGFRIGVTEQPYKIPFYAAALRLLHEQPDDTGPSIGKLVLDDFWKGFQAYLDRLAWRETRLCIHFFAHLTMAKIISPESMFALLQSFTSVLDEFGVSYGRAKRAALCAAEGLMIGGPILKSNSAANVVEIINAIQAYNDTTTSAKWLVQPTIKIYSDAVQLDNADELLDTLLHALNDLNSTDFAETSSSFCQPYSGYPDLGSHVLFDLPSVLVPPEVIELDGLAGDGEGNEGEGDGGEGGAPPVKKEDWPEYFLRLFDGSITPTSTTPPGYAVRSAIRDIIDIFEVNRKECARLLLEYPKWSVEGTFKPKPGATGEVVGVTGKDWQLESTLIETILSTFLILPESTHKSIYHIGLITELCKLSPQTVGPAVGKSIRKLYGGLDGGWGAGVGKGQDAGVGAGKGHGMDGGALDVEIARRFAEWFAVHMSNFGFQWVWKEWVPDLALNVQHPRRAFMRRALEFEIRLSYHDRILKTLPEVMQAPDAYTISEEAPGPDFEFDDPAKPHHDAAQAVLNLFRGRAKAEDVISHLDTLKNTLEASDSDSSVSVDKLVRSIAVQSLLHIGSRSFSHLLNAIERYLPLLRYLASGGGSVGGGLGSAGTGTGGIGSGNAEAKADILTAAAAFWKHNRQMVGIVFDKLMQYQIVDPTDVVGWTFVNGAGISSGQPGGSGGGPLSLSAFEWDLLKGALDKANGRVMIARRKVIALRKEDDDTRARAMASGGDTMEVDGDVKQEETPAADNPALTTALKAFTSLTREQKAALSRTLDGFVSCLAPSSSAHNPNPDARAILTENSWNDRANWDRDEWNAWETWGWYRQFCRVYSPYLRNYANTLYIISFSKFEGSTDPAAELLKKTWNVAIGQDV